MLECRAIKHYDYDKKQLLDGVGKLHIDHYEDVQCVKFPINRFFQYMSVYVYFVDDLMIDTGPKHSKRRIGQFLVANNISKAAITHEHSDHCGTARWLVKKHDIVVYTNKANTKRSYFSLRSIHTLAEQYPEKIECSHHTFLPIFTPGHTRDHTCLYEPNKGWLFTGDLYITSNPTVSLWSESLSKYIDSLKTVAALDFDTIFCAHQGVVQNGKQMILEKLHYLETIQSEAVELYEQGYSSRMIAKKLFPKKARLERLTFGAFSSLHLVRQLIRAHNKHV